MATSFGGPYLVSPPTAPDMLPPRATLEWRGQVARNVRRLLSSLRNKSQDFKTDLRRSVLSDALIAIRELLSQPVEGKIAK